MKPSVIRALACAIGSALAPMTGCDKATPPAPVVASSPGDGVYTVRGRVESLPGVKPGSQLRVHHEHIPNFKGKDGEVHRNRDGSPGMLEMSMEFPLAPGVDLAGLAVGDAVEMTFEVRWNSPPPIFRATAIRKLPPDTELRLSVPKGP